MADKLQALSDSMFLHERKENGYSNKDKVNFIFIGLGFTSLFVKMMIFYLVGQLIHLLSHKIDPMNVCTQREYRRHYYITSQ